MGAMLFTGPAPIAILDSPIAAQGLPGQLALRRRLRNDTCRRSPGSTAAPRHLARPFGDAALPAPPLTRQTTSAATPTSPPWAWRPARDPRRRSSAARDPSPLLLLHSAPTSHCARVHPDHQCLAFFMGPDHTRAPRPRHPALRPGPRALLSNPGHVPMVTLCPAHGPDPDAPKRPPFDHLVTSPRTKPAHSGPGPVPDAHGHVPTSRLGPAPPA